MRLTKEERFIYELGKALDESSVTLFQLVDRCSIGSKSIHAIVQRLQRGNYIRCASTSIGDCTRGSRRAAQKYLKSSESQASLQAEVTLTDHGKKLFESLKVSLSD